MSFTETIIEPISPEHQDTLVMYPYPIFGNVQNTGSRLQALADQFGAPIVASDLYLQNKKTIFDMAAREANQPGGDVYMAMSQRRADFFTSIADNMGATTRIGMGDSLAVSAIQGMQLYADYEPFDALLLRDGWNLDEETTVFRGISRYAKYQIEDTLHQRRDRVKFDIPTTDYEQVPAQENETSPLAKLRNVADMMRGPHNRNNAILLAKLSSVAMNVVTFTNGLSATDPSRLQEFNRRIREARRSRLVFGSTSKLLAQEYPGWHSDLMDPERGARDLLQTVGLLTK